ncbi:hypothetical protein BGZ97_000261 [Linnemannia gamsii]|uniref:SGNH hydrolase-type esterase domain-containing protein n=1 Tax=Linnemannia gamsii TaxID=64522 RepID=A0A9P6RM61_9FUNG|nr:hypothetical protein BGZ97_000261 [Linnemannia gamsii]
MPLSTVLIGDSMIERFKTTGASTGLAQLPGSFNAGCGGDKIENVLFRLDLMYPLLQNCNSIKVWVVMVGTNNLRKKGFRPTDVALYHLLLQALLRVAPGSKVLLCEMFQRQDIGDQYVDEANRMVRGMIDEMNRNLGEVRVVWSEAPEDFTKRMLEDHFKSLDMLWSNYGKYRQWAILAGFISPTTSLLPPSTAPITSKVTSIKDSSTHDSRPLDCSDVNWKLLPRWEAA